MAWNNVQFDEALRKKYEILGQNATSDTTRANAVAQDVAQRPGMQAAQDTAAMDRARLAAQTQLGVAGINESGANARTGMTTQAQRDIAALQDAGADRRTGMQTQSQRDIAALQDQGALARTQLTTGTQKAIADQSLGVERDKIAEDSYNKRVGLTRPMTIYDQDGMRSSVPGVDFSKPLNVGIESPFSSDEETRKARNRLAGVLGQ